MSGVTLIACYPSARSENDAVSAYGSIGHVNLGIYTTESQTQVTYRTAGVFSGLYCRVTANTTTGNGSLHLRINGASGNEVVSITAGTTGEFQDTTHTDVISAGNKIGYLLTVGSGSSTSMSFSIVAALFSATYGTCAKLINSISSSGTGYTSTSTTTYLNIVGAGTAGSNESQQQHKMRMSGTLSDLQINVISNTRTDTCTIAMRVGGSNGNEGISVLSDTTGIFEDTLDTDAVSSGSLIDYAVTTGSGSGNLVVGPVSCELTSPNSLAESVCGSSGITAAANTTQNWSVAGTAAASTATEANVQCKSQVTYNASNLLLHLTANSVTAASTGYFRVNGANGNQTISIGSSSTGFFEDTVDTDAVPLSAETDYQIVLGATGTSITWTGFSHLMTLDNAPVFIPPVVYEDVLWLN